MVDPPLKQTGALVPDSWTKEQKFVSFVFVVAQIHIQYILYLYIVYICGLWQRCNSYANAWHPSRPSFRLIPMVVWICVNRCVCMGSAHNDKRKTTTNPVNQLFDQPRIRSYGPIRFEAQDRHRTFTIHTIHQFSIIMNTACNTFLINILYLCVVGMKSNVFGF